MMSGLLQGSHPSPWHWVASACLADQKSVTACYWHPLNKISAACGCSRMAAHTVTLDRGARPEFINHAHRRPLISVALCETHAETCQQTHTRAKCMRADTHARPQTLWHTLNKTWEPSKLILPTYAEHSTGRAWHCAARWQAAGLSFNLGTRTQVSIKITWIFLSLIKGKTRNFTVQ